jgi:Uncharacterized conserved protein related to C-terminal domain of eukaryotic chaperone, SACSIN
MNETIREWVAKAEGDFHTAGRELAAAESPNFDAVCFHAQQCIEKLMKALLIARGADVSKTHDLAELGRFLRLAGEAPFGDAEELRFLIPGGGDFPLPRGVGGPGDRRPGL